MTGLFGGSGISSELSDLSETIDVTPTGSVELSFSSGTWDFKDNALSGVGDVTMSGDRIVRNTSSDDLFISGGSSAALGANLRLYGESHPTQAFDIEFRSNAIVRLQWDNSSSSLNCQANDLINAGTIRPNSYTVATVPSASGKGAGSQIYVTDETSGPTGAESDGTNWRRYADRAIIS